MTTQKLIDEILERLPMTADDPHDPALDTVANMVLEGMRYDRFFTDLVLAAEKRGRTINVRMLAQLVDELAAMNGALQNQIAELQQRLH